MAGSPGKYSLSKSFFISDLHLDSEQKPHVTTLFLSFIEFVKKQSGDLYILGDLFDYWANNRTLFNKEKSVLCALQKLQQTGSKVAVLWGNRDFLLKASHLASFGLELFPEEHTQRIQGRRILMAHGHNFCPADCDFQRYRRRWWKIFRLLDTFLPGIIENYIAQKIRRRSQQAVAQLDTSGLGLSEDIIKQHFTGGVDTIICGHIHCPEIKEYNANKSLVILPAWDTEGGYCLLEGGKLKLLTYPNTYQKH